MQPVMRKTDPSPATPPILVLLCALALPSGCKDQAKESATRASADVASLGALVDKDVGEIERGLPEGAKRLATLLANGADPKQDVADVRKASSSVRRDVPDLDIAKSTFFALADSTGVAIRNDLEEDVMAGQNLFTIFPALAKAKDAYTTAVGAFPNGSTKNGPDEDWVAAAPVKRDDGVDGRALRDRLDLPLLRSPSAGVAEGQTRRGGQEERRGEAKMPVFYVAVFDKTGVYSAPLTPVVDEQALAAQDLVGKTAAGPAQGTLNLTDRAFGWAAVRAPKLAPDTGVVVLRSEL